LLLKEKKNPNFIVILASLIFILYITKFNRLSEYGADLGGQLLAILSFVFCSTAYFERKKLNKENLLNIVEISFYFSIFAVTTKILYIIYFIIPLFVSLRILRFKDLLFHFLNLRFLGISILCLTTILFYNFSSSGCLIYPASFTCFYGAVSWSLSEETINLMRSHYNAWSKGGIGAGYSVTDIGSYIKNLNWILNWVDLYFFTKVTDFLGLIFFIFVLICIVFFKNIKWKKSLEYKNHYYLSIYFPVIIVLLIWFFNFPTLRYAGYSIVFLFFAIPLSLFLSNKIDLKNSKVRKKFTILLIISIVVFNLRNLDRINNELSINYDEHHNFGNFPYYWVNDVNFDKHKTQNLILNITEKGSKCWATPSVCITAIGVDTKKISNFIIYYIK
jgi:hypothetical protein